MDMRWTTQLLAVVAAAALMGQRAGTAWRAVSGMERLAKRLTAAAALCWLLLSVVLWFAADRMSWLRFLDLFVSCLLLAAVDVRDRVLPARLLWELLAAQLVLALAADSLSAVFGNVLAGLLFGGAAAGLSLLSRDSFGMGDAKLLGIIAIAAGWRYALVIFVLGVFLSAFYGIWLLAARRRGMRSEIPFVPFLAAAMAAHMGLLLAMR